MFLGTRNLGEFCIYIIKVTSGNAQRNEFRGVFQLKWLKSEFKHEFEQKARNSSINRKHLIDNYIDLVSIEIFQSLFKCCRFLRLLLCFIKMQNINIIGWSKGQGHIRKRGSNFFSSLLLWLEAIITKSNLSKKYLHGNFFKMMWQWKKIKFKFFI